MSDLTPWMGKSAKLREQNKRSATQEAAVASETGGKVQGGSGSSWRAPRDVKTPEALIECKYTDKPTYTLDVREWLSYVQSAQRAGREAEMIIEFSNFLGTRLRITEI